MLLEIAVVNNSKLFPKMDDWMPILRAVQTQLNRDIGPILQIVPPSIGYYPSLSEVPAHASALTILDDPDMPDAAGYHNENTAGVVSGKVFVKPSIDNGGSLFSGANSVSCTLSHEVIEMIPDPFIQLWALNFLKGFEVAYEFADPVESDEGYAIDGVSVSNFVTDRWFDSQCASNARFDFLGNLKAPFTLSPGGYMTLKNANTSPHQIFGSEYPAWKKALKAKWGRGAQRRLQPMR